jgi:hypothetical protein
MVLASRTALPFTAATSKKDEKRRKADFMADDIVAVVIAVELGCFLTAVPPLQASPLYVHPGKFCFFI